MKFRSSLARLHCMQLHRQGRPWPSSRHPACASPDVWGLQFWDTTAQPTLQAYWDHQSPPPPAAPTYNAPTQDSYRFKTLMLKKFS